MELTLTTPAILFPTISLLMVAYTNRFLAITKRIRALHDIYITNPERVLKEQIASLRTRLHLIRNMQASCVASLFFCVLCIFILFAGHLVAAKIIFVIGLVLLMISLMLSFREIQLSVEALNLAISDMEKYE